MIIRPVDTETVIADQVVIPYTDRIGNRVRIEQAFTGQFMNTGGASTGDPEIPVAEMLSTFVTPENFESMLSIEEIDRGVRGWGFMDSLRCDSVSLSLSKMRRKAEGGDMK
ncbi:MAG: hypothetical protein QF752_03925 [Planctomycetota bacterium]|nr:hypothetical protein [Planctomycetota bacterium]